MAPVTFVLTDTIENEVYFLAKYTFSEVSSNKYYFGSYL